MKNCALFTLLVNLQEVMTDMSVLVHQQGEQVNSLADNVDHTSMITTEAREDIIQAKRLQDMNRRRMCIIATILFFLFGGAGLTLYLMKVNDRLPNSNNQ